MMRKSILLLLCLTTAALCSAQLENPVKWSFSAKKIDATTYEIHLTAQIENSWHLYSQTTPEGGPVPTSITFGKNPLLSLSGTAKEVGKMEQVHEEMFGVDVKQFAGTVDFVQIVKRKSTAKTSVKGELEYMVCNDKMCLPPKKVSFNIALQ